MTKRVKLILIGILILSFAVRIYHLTSVPPALNQDEAINGYDAYVLGLTLKDHHGNFLPPMLESFGDWTSPLITYLTVPFVKLFGLSLFSIRLLVALLGVASIYLLYLFLIQLFKKQDLALLGAFLLAISPWHITLSRWAIPPGIVTFFLLLFLWTFFRAINFFEKNGSIWKFITPGLTAGLLVYSYPTQKLFVPLFILSLAFIYLRSHLKTAFVFLLSFTILVSPIYILTFSDSKYNARFTGVSGLSDPKAKQEIIGRYVEYFLPYFHFQTGDTDKMHQVPTIGNSYLFLSIFFYTGILISLLGFFKIIKIPNVDHKTYAMLLSWLLLFPIAASLTKDHNMVLRAVHGLPLVAIFSIVTFSYLWQYLKKPYPSIFIIIITLFGLINLGNYSKFYFTQYPDLVYRDFQYGITDFMSYLLKNDSRFDKVVIDDTINQPYIYYLFSSQFDPKKLNYKNPALSSSKYVFGPVSTQIISTLPPDFTVSYKDTPQFSIYHQDSVWYVKKF